MRNAMVVGLTAILLPAGASISAMQTAVPSIDSSKVKFFVSCSNEPPNTIMSTRPNTRSVIGVVARDVDLTIGAVNSNAQQNEQYWGPNHDDATAKQIALMGVAAAQEKCPQPYKFGSITVSVVPGNPADVVSPESIPKPSMELGGFTADNFGTFYGMYNDIKDSTLRLNIRNYSKVRLEAEVAGREKEAARQAELARQRQAEQSRQAVAAAKVAKTTGFAKTNGVKQFVIAGQLAANPFVYQGQVVGVYGVFEQMTSATTALFSAEGVKAFQVSGVPSGRFVQRAMVMLAGSVLGNVEVKLPILGPTLVPHLKFVGSAFCQEQGCRDYPINAK